MLWLRIGYDNDKRSPLIFSQTHRAISMQHNKLKIWDKMFILIKVIFFVFNFKVMMEINFV